ncbi:FAD-dependent oxidoreductase [Zhongshania sp.]|uniref:FAD-dependent oxidoreductase n=1 Tax=Zhongshania sp. TaxID=1971902 RepID=UPI0035630AA6
MSDEVFDFVVVGSGGGSMCAALVMRAAGKSVLILEKSELLGGTTAISGGVMWIPNNRYMKEAGIPDSREDAIAYLDATIGDDPAMLGATKERRLAYVDESPKMIDFLVEQGIKLRRIPSWPDYYKAPGESVPGRTVVSELFDLKQLGPWKSKLRPGFLPLPANLDEAMQLGLMKRSTAAKKILAKIIGRVIKDIFTAKKRTTAGQALQGQMLLAAVNAGVEIRVSSAVKQLIVEDGRVSGVIVEKDGEECRIGARNGVLINAGGFARNQQMLDEYIPGVSSDWTMVVTEDTGDLIQEGMRIGAAVAQMGERISYAMALPPGGKGPVPLDVAKPYSVVVDQSGSRYTNEAASIVEVSRSQLARNKSTPSMPSWLVFDSHYMRTFMLAGSMAGMKKPKEWTEEKFLRQGNTIEELAAACEIDPANLTATVERFNAFAEKGCDEDFHRGEHAYQQWMGDPLKDGDKTLGPITEAPFFAVPFYPGDVSTFGGLVTDSHARVLREDGSAIDGLYATGTSTASVAGGVELGAGGSIGPSFTFGYLAAKHAVSIS